MIERAYLLFLFLPLLLFLFLTLLFLRSPLLFFNPLPLFLFSPPCLLLQPLLLLHHRLERADTSPTLLLGRGRGRCRLFLFLRFLLFLFLLVAPTSCAFIILVFTFRCRSLRCGSWCQRRRLLTIFSSSSLLRCCLSLLLRLQRTFMSRLRSSLNDIIDIPFLVPSLASPSLSWTTFSAHHRLQHRRRHPCPQGG